MELRELLKELLKELLDNKVYEDAFELESMTLTNLTPECI